jgi:hypothetical protein
MFDFDPRDHDPRDALTRTLGLPRGRERGIVHERDREYTLRGSETRVDPIGSARVRFRDRDMVTCRVEPCHRHTPPIN